MASKKDRPLPTPKQPKPWDPPPHPKAGDATDETTFAAIGRALSAWENFEISMATLFARFCSNIRFAPPDRIHRGEYLCREGAGGFARSVENRLKNTCARLDHLGSDLDRRIGGGFNASGCRPHAFRNTSHSAWGAPLGMVR